MSSDQLANLFSQSIFLSGLLAGFSITIVVQLVAMGRKSRLASSSICAFLVSAGLLVVSTVAFVFMLVALIGAPGAQQSSAESLVELGVGMGNLMVLGLVAFLIGIGITGWLQSKLVGIISTLIAASSLAGIVAIIRRVFFG